MIPIHDGLASLADRYDGFIVDLWGVLHDGARAFPEAVTCLERLRRHGKRVLILSNAPRRAAAVAARNAELGIAPGLWDAVMSSGEDAWRHLAERPDPWYRALGRRCYHLGPERDRGMREGLDYDFVEEIAEADFILNTGAAGGDDTVERYVPLLEQADRLRLPMICANPDLEVVRGGRREICAGAIAARYEAMGGAVRYHGKPHPGIYQACFRLLDGVARARLAAIGDALRTDIAGANAVGIDGIFVTGGLQGEALGVDAQGYPEPARLAALCEAEGQFPVAALPVLRW
ncbi:MAG: TIGR01459 family HAD-type hydrolase [Kiloniellaceae bacterium]